MNGKLLSFHSNSRTPTWTFTNVIFILCAIYFLYMFHRLHFADTGTADWAKKPRAPCCDTNFDEILNLPAKDQKVLDYIRCHNARPPSTLPYNFTSVPYGSVFKTELQLLFGNVMGGVFLECGANDGLKLSNTLDLEMYQQWSGVLIEANPIHIPPLFATQRKATIVDACLSPTEHVARMEFLSPGKGLMTYSDWRSTVGKLVMPEDLNVMPLEHYEHVGSVKCFPLVSILAAVGIKHVNFFSLDVEGVELKILKTLPYDDTLIIDVILVEFNNDPEGPTAMKNFMVSKGYKVVMTTPSEFVFKRIESFNE